jgi:anti-sigma B factor antagonist
MNQKSWSLDDVTIFALSGRFDAHEAPGVAAALKEAATRTPARLVVDLGEVHFIDSMALGALVQSMKHCRQQGGNLRICNLQQPVRIIFELTRLDRAFTLFENKEQAVQTPWSQDEDQGMR